MSKERVRAYVHSRIHVYTRTHTDTRTHTRTHARTHTSLASLVPVYTLLLRESVLKGCTPRNWKTSTVIPVPKKRSPSQLNDYRPVALTSVPFTCTERIVLNELRLQTAAHQDVLHLAQHQRQSTDCVILTSST